MDRWVVVDLDGTLADVEHRKHLIKGPKKNWKAFHEACARDHPNPWCVALIRALLKAGIGIQLVSGRSREVQAETEAWLEKLFPRKDRIVLVLLRAGGDFTPDTELKRAWLKSFGKHRVLFAVDDRARVVKMWREEGVVCLQCDDWEERESVRK